MAISREMGGLIPPDQVKRKFWALLCNVSGQWLTRYDDNPENIFWSGYSPFGAHFAEFEETSKFSTKKACEEARDKIEIAMRSWGDKEFKWEIHEWAEGTIVYERIRRFLNHDYGDTLWHQGTDYTMTNSMIRVLQSITLPEMIESNLLNMLRTE